MSRIKNPKYLFLQKYLGNLLEIHTGRQKICFDILLNKFTKKNLAMAPSPYPAWFYCSFKPLKGGRTFDVMWSAVQRSASQHARPLLFPYQTEGSI
jgi:hypothetical protein